MLKLDWYEVFIRKTYIYCYTIIRSHSTVIFVNTRIIAKMLSIVTSRKKTQKTKI